jgi:hypothetical protein
VPLLPGWNASNSGNAADVATAETALISQSQKGMVIWQSKECDAPTRRNRTEPRVIKQIIFKKTLCHRYLRFRGRQKQARKKRNQSSKPKNNLPYFSNPLDFNRIQGALSISFSREKEMDKRKHAERNRWFLSGLLLYRRAVSAADLLCPVSIAWQNGSVSIISATKYAFLL